MTKSILDIKDWYTIEDVCFKLNANIHDIQDLIEQKKLTAYGKLFHTKLLGFKALKEPDDFIGKTLIIYTGLVKIIRFKTSDFIKNKSLISNSVLIENSGMLKTVDLENDSPSWIYQTFRYKWSPPDENETLNDFQYCSYRAHEESFVGSLKKSIYTGYEAAFGNIYKIDSTLTMKEIREIAEIDFVTINLCFLEEDIRFSRKQIDKLIEQSFVEKEEKNEQPYLEFSWFNSSSRSNPFRKVIESLYSKNESCSATQLWEILKEDSKQSGIYDPDCIILEVGTDEILIKETNREKAIQKKRFIDMVYEYKKFLRMKVGYN